MVIRQRIRQLQQLNQEKRMVETMKDTCKFCSEHECLEEHHIVPQRYGGPDASFNLVKLCPNCHRKIENLYTDSAFAMIQDSENIPQYKNRFSKQLMQTKKRTEQLEEMAEDEEVKKHLEKAKLQIRIADQKHAYPVIEEFQDA